MPQTATRQRHCRNLLGCHSIKQDTPAFDELCQVVPWKPVRGACWWAML